MPIEKKRSKEKKNCERRELLWHLLDEKKYLNGIFSFVILVWRQFLFFLFGFLLKFWISLLVKRAGKAKIVTVFINIFFLSFLYYIYLFHFRFDIKIQEHDTIKNENKNDCFRASPFPFSVSMWLSFIKLVTCGCWKCDRNIGFYGLS